MPFLFYSSLITVNVLAESSDAKSLNAAHWFQIDGWKSGLVELSTAAQALSNSLPTFYQPT